MKDGNKATIVLILFRNL